MGEKNGCCDMEVVTMRSSKVNVLRVAREIRSCQLGQPHYAGLGLKHPGESQVSGSMACELKRWFDERWSLAEPLDSPRIAEERHRTAALREEFVILAARCRLLDRPGIRPAVAFTGAVPTLIDSSVSYFLCNTNRRWSERSPSGEYTDEQLMMAGGSATAWEVLSIPRAVIWVIRRVWREPRPH